VANTVPTISTHVIDTGRGVPVAGLSIEVSLLGDDDREAPLTTVTTDRDGRVADLLGRPLEPGTYRLRFQIGERSPFFAAMALDVHVADLNRSYHIPLLLSPFGLSTYLGS
jgi:5-hydroxyisourate hydrolase